MPEIITIAKASPIGKQPVPGLAINFVGEPPRIDSLDKAKWWFSAQAALLEDALHKILPGGTYDRLLGLMLARKSSHFIIAHGGEAEDVPS